MRCSSSTLPMTHQVYNHSKNCGTSHREHINFSLNLNYFFNSSLCSFIYSIYDIKSSTQAYQLMIDCRNFTQRQNKNIVLLENLFIVVQTICLWHSQRHPKRIRLSVNQKKNLWGSIYSNNESSKLFGLLRIQFENQIRSIRVR